MADIVDPFKIARPDPNARVSGGIVDPFKVERPVPAAVSALEQDNSTPTPSAFRASDIPKELASGAVEGAGAIVSGVGDFGKMVARPIVAGVNALADDPYLLSEPKNPFARPGAAISELGARIADTESDAAKEAKAKPVVEGDITSPSTLKIGEGATDAKSLGLKAAGLLGQLAPLLAGGLESRALKLAPAIAEALPGIAAKLKAGTALTDAETAIANTAAKASASAARRTTATGAAIGGVQGAESAANVERDRVMQMSDDELANLPAYSEKLKAGLSPAAARAALAEDAASGAFTASLPVATAAGAVSAAPLLHEAQSALSKVAGTSVARRAAVGAGAEAAVQAPLGVAQQAAEVAGANEATGEERNPLEDSAAAAGAGAVMGAGFGAIAGVATRPGSVPKVRPAAEQRFPDAQPGTIADAANAVPVGETPREAAAAGRVGTTPAPEVAPAPGSLTEAAMAVAPHAAPEAPWLNKETGEFRRPTDDEVKDAFHTMFENASSAGSSMAATAASRHLAEEWGVPFAKLRTLRKDALEERNKGFKPGDKRPMDESASSEQTAAPAPAEPSNAEAAADPNAGDGLPDAGAVRGVGEGADSARVEPVSGGAQLGRGTVLGADGARAAEGGEPVPDGGADRADGGDGAVRDRAGEGDAGGDAAPAAARGEASVRSGEGAVRGSEGAAVRVDNGDRLAGEDAGRVARDGQADREAAKSVEGADGVPAAAASKEPAGDEAAAPVREEPTAAGVVSEADAAREARQPGDERANLGPDATRAAEEIDRGAPGDGDGAAEAVRAGGARRDDVPLADAEAASRVDEAALAAAQHPENEHPEPTDAQKEAGNYRKGHVNLHGMDVSIETPAGARRRPEWNPLANHYGYIRKTEGADGDHVDAFLGPHAEDASKSVYVIDQKNPKTGRFDEHKVMLGFASGREARKAYQANYQKGWRGFHGITEMSLDQFKGWLKSGDTTKPAMAATEPPQNGVKLTKKQLADKAVARAQELGAAPPTLPENRLLAKPTGFPVGGFHAVDPEGNVLRKGRPDGQLSPRYKTAEAADKAARAELAKRPIAETKTAAKVDAALKAATERTPAEQLTVPGPKTAGRENDATVESIAAAKSKESAPTTKAEPALGNSAEKPPAKSPATETGKIEDIGTKLGGARKDTARPTGKTARAKVEDDRPTWAKRFDIGQIVKSSKPEDEGQWSITDKKNTDWRGQPRQLGKFATKEEAERALPLLAVAQKHRVRMANDGTFGIVRDITDRKRIALKEGFKSRDEAMQYMAEHARELLEQKTSLGEEALPKPETVGRAGPPKREGNVEPQKFADDFGFRGVEFGNWNNQAERQEVMNHAYDGLHDLAEVLGIPAKAISLNGELGLAFGARGQGLSSARAHYERDYAVMNLTKLQGAGALAHEWFHALDHYLARQDTKASSERVKNDRGDTVIKASDRNDDYLSHGASYNSKLRAELKQAYGDLIRTMATKAEKFVRDTTQAENFTRKTREGLAEMLGKVREHLANDRQYGAKKKAASAEQLADFDAIANGLISGEDLATAHKYIEPTGKQRRSSFSGRFTNDKLEQLSAIIKDVTGRTGFNAERKGDLDKIRDQMARYETRLNALAEAKKGTELEKGVPTSFRMNAIAADQGRGTDYWSTQHEMAARAFSAYVEDKLAEQGRSSDFLSYGSDPNFALPLPEYPRPFPGGDERKAINAAFDKLFATIQTREGEGGNVGLFDMAEGETAAPNAKAVEVARAVREAVKGWGPNAPKVRVLASAEHLPDIAKKLAPTRYKEAKGFYDADTGSIYIVAPNQPSVERALQSVVHEAVGHYGVDRIVDEFGKGGMDQLVADITRLRTEGLGSDAMKAVFNDVARRYPNADPHTFAREAIAIAAERGIRNSLVGRVIAALKAFVRKIFPNLSFSENDLRAMLSRSEDFLRAEPKQAPLQQRLAAQFSAPAKPFYSALHESMQTARGAPKVADAGAWRQWLDGAQRRGEFKQAEREWMGVDQFLDEHKGQVTRQELQDYIARQQVPVTERTLSDRAGLEKATFDATRAQTTAYDLLRREVLKPLERAANEAYERAQAEHAAAAPDAVTAELEGFPLPPLRPEQLLAPWSGDAEEQASFIEKMRRMPGYKPEMDAIANDYFEKHRARDAAIKARNEGGTPQFAQYTTPGGENYRELLIHLPRKEPTLAERNEMLKAQVEYRNAIDKFAQGREDDLPQDQLLALARARDEAQERYQRLDRGIDDTLAQNFQSSHFADTPNILAHVRMNDRVGPNGEKILHLEEIQSDWHQKGRREGYEPSKTAPAGWASTGDARSTGEGVPDAPFKKEWPMLAFKRALREAVDGGYDRVTWTTGDTQNARYDLSKSVSAIGVRPTREGRNVAIKIAGGGTHQLTLDKEGRITSSSEPAFIGKPIADAVGKDVGERIMAATEHVQLKGDDLKLGGKGMRGFYDEMLPKEVAKYVKQWGGKVERSEIVPDLTKVPADARALPAEWELEYDANRVDAPHDWTVRDEDRNVIASGDTHEAAREAALRIYDANAGEDGALRHTVPVHSLDITDAMRGSVREGQPMFDLGAADRAGLTRGQEQDPAVVADAAREWKENGVKSPYFQKFFDGSKVTTPTGRPKVVFHGTAADFRAFDGQRAMGSTEQPQAALGHYFTEHRADAENYATQAADSKEAYGIPAKERVIEAYVAIKKPFEMSAADFREIATPQEARSIQGQLRAAGFDGIHLVDADQWVAFDSDQIKSVENRGTFDRAHGDINFSLPEASMDTLDEVLAKPDKTAWQRAKAAIRGKYEDLRPALLGALQTRHVLELAEELTPLKGAAHYAEQMQRLAADREQLITGAPDAKERPGDMLAKGGAAIAKDLQDLAFEKGPAGWLGRRTEESKRLADVMNNATIHGLDPSKPYAKLQIEDSKGDGVEWTTENIKERIKALRGQMRGRPGDDKSMLMDEVKRLRNIPKREKRRIASWPELVAKYEALSPEAKKSFQEQRDWYDQMSTETEKALINRIEALGTEIDGKYLRSLKDRVRLQFETQRKEGIYFPLDRNGDFWVSFTDKEGEQGFKMFETAKEAIAAEEKLRAAGFKIDAQGRRDSTYRAKDAPPGTFVAGIVQLLKKSGAPEKVQDEVVQLFLKTLPEMSMRKHSIHRRNVPGYESDPVRSFAKNAFHGAHQLARLRHSHEMQATIDAMQKSLDNYRRGEIGESATSTTPEIAKADALLAELKKRHDFIMSPKDTGLANTANAIGFAYYLGASPASALVNLTQNAQVTLPVLAAHHGWAKASRMLGAAVRDSLRTFGNLDRTLTSDEERQAYNVLRQRGDIDKTQSHTLAGLAEGSLLTTNPVWAKTMGALTYMFHKAEVINREAAGMAAYRLARSRGDDFNAAVRYASDIVNGTHFDYSAANRPRYMQGGVARTIGQFKNYAVGMTWALYRNLYQSFKGQTVEARSHARRTLTGILGMTALLAGSMGLPIFNALRFAGNAAHTLFGEDEPFDFDTEFRAWLAENMGPEAAKWIADGVVNRAGIDIASRVGLSNLWMQHDDRELEGDDRYHALLEAIAGPMGGLVKNFYVGSKQVGDGNVQRGIETMLPNFAKNAMKAVRFESEGANSLRGDPILPDVTTPEAFVQSLGFRPTRLAEQQRTNTALKNYEQGILDRRASLLNALAMATNSGDSADRTAALAKIHDFNQRFPEIALKSETIRQSLKARARYSAEAENGIILNKKLAPRLRSAIGGEGTDNSDR